MYRKARIPIRLRGENRPDYKDGYTFEACFSNGELFEVGVYKNARGEWNVTDLNTGLFVNCGVTRGVAVKQFQDKYLSKLERLVLHNANNVYREMTAEFQAMLKEGAK